MGVGGAGKMYKILLVDDEYFHREALKHSISWEEYGCTICGEANNGLAGIEQAIDLLPDIVLVDISMPFMDGLEMIENTKRVLPEAIYAIITGYSEFEYAKRGIELGIKYFVVKPVDDIELVKIINQMVQELDARKEKKEEYTSLRFWADKNVRNNRREFLHMLLSDAGEIDRERFLYECEHLQIPIRQGGYGVCCLKVDVRTPISLSTEGWEQKIAEMLAREQLKNQYVVFCTREGGHILFANLAESEWDVMQMRAVMQKLQIRFMQELVCTAVAGVGSYCTDYRQIPNSCLEAETSMTEIATSKLITRMLNYIHDNYGDADLTLHKIAAELYANYSYLSAQFTKEIGMTTSQYIQRFRMTKAVDALSKGGDNMVKIACDAGYTDVKYFYRCFKKEFGVTPNQYMDMIQKQKKLN